MIDMLLFLVGAVLFWSSTFILISVLIKKGSRTVSTAELFLLSAMSLALLVLVFTDGLRLFSALTQGAVRVAWCLLSLLSVIANLVVIRNDHKL